jgi:ferric-dicitrate binding protein FerR (iron transport regulator)
LISDPKNESIFKKLLYDQLNELQNDQVLFDYSLENDRIYANILQSIKQNELIESEMKKITRKARVRKILIYCSSLAAVFIIAFLLGNFLSIYGGKPSYASPTEYTYNEIKAPFGSKTEIKLPDGTVVLLNAGSTIKYSNDFNLKNRDLNLIGEAYFTVAKNVDIPLNVSAGNISIKAVGTEFNVKAYEDEGIIETTLIEGKVEIIQEGQNKENTKFMDLTPNHKAVYSKETDSFTLEKIKPPDTMIASPLNPVSRNNLVQPKVDIADEVAWTKGKLIIRGESLDNLCVDLQRKYDVKFVFNNDEIKRYRFSGVLLDETLEQVLGVIKLTAPINFLVEGKTVYLSSDKEQLDNYSKHLK